MRYSDDKEDFEIPKFRFRDRRSTLPRLPLTGLASNEKELASIKCIVPALISGKEYGLSSVIKEARGSVSGESQPFGKVDRPRHSYHLSMGKAK